MGMDVFGKKPTAKAGEYFRASIWSWPPIHGLMIELCSDFLDMELLKAMGFNAGAGPDNGGTCSEIADRFQAWMETHRGGHAVYVEPEAGFEHAILNMLRSTGWDVRQGGPSYQVDDEHLREWVEFLQHCGGFAVY